MFPGNPYQEFIFLRTYSRWVDSLRRRETFEEAVNRYAEFMFDQLKKFGVNRGLEKMFWWAVDHIRGLSVMPSMRALWTAGPALKKDHVAGYNCSYLEINSPKKLAELLYILMNGTGVGFSVERQVIDALPPVPKSITPSEEEIIFADSKRGWAEGLYQYLRGMWNGSAYLYNLSSIRPRGARLKTFGGRASGPEPLQELLEYIHALFLQARGRKLNSLECHDLCCRIASVVMVGGVRRSACISLSNLSDDRMAGAKSGDWWTNHYYRQYSNNSVAYTERPDARRFLAEWLKLVESQSGERGIFNRQAAEFAAIKTGRRKPGFNWGTNPCIAGSTMILTAYGPKTMFEVSMFSEIPVYTMGPNREIVIRKATHPRRTNRAGLVIEIFTDDQSLVCTKNHPIAVPLPSGGVDWVQAGNLAVGDKIITVDIEGDCDKFVTKEQVITKIEPRPREPVYNMEVEETQNYIANWIVVHNCGEIILRPDEFCNLTEVVVREDDTLQSLKEKVVAATILGVIQSTLTDFRFIGRSWKTNCEEERLLGVSLTGLMDCPLLNHTNEEVAVVLNQLKMTAIETAREWSSGMHIPMPAAITCVKPSGTVSQLVNSSSGIHARYSQYYIRRVQVAASDPLCKLLIAAGVPHHPAPNEDPNNPQNYSFEFPMKSPNSSVCKDQLSAIDQLEYWKMVKEHWAEHNPSCTVYVRDDEWAEVGAWVYRNWYQICGITFLPVDKNIYIRPPYEEIDEDAYLTLLAKFPKVDYSKLSEFEEEDTTEGSREFACSAGACEI